MVMNNAQFQWLTKTDFYFLLWCLHLCRTQLDSTSSFILELRLKKHLISGHNIVIKESSRGASIRWCAWTTYKALFKFCCWRLFLWTISELMRWECPLFLIYWNASESHSKGQGHIILLPISNIVILPIRLVNNNRIYDNVMKEKCCTQINDIIITKK